MCVPGVRISKKAAWRTFFIIQCFLVTCPSAAEENQAVSNQDNVRCELPQNDEELKKLLSPEQYRIMKENGTERPFANEYWNNKAAGIYVDRISGEPLFSSTDKFDSGTGWPSFTQPIQKEMVQSKRDTSHGMERIEVRSKSSDSHLGHVFNDGPADRGGLRYCINSASLKFIPAEDLSKEGYEEFQYLFEKKDE